MNTFIIFLAFLAVPSFAKLVWKTDKDMLEKVNIALKSSEYYVDGEATVIELGASEPTNNPIIALCQTLPVNCDTIVDLPNIKGAPPQPSFFYLAMDIDAEGNVSFTSGSNHYSCSPLAKVYASHFVKSLAFKYVWQRFPYYYTLLKKSPPPTTRKVDLASAYGISGSSVIMTCTTSDGRVGVIHSKYTNNFFFTVRLKTGNGSFTVIHTSGVYNLLYVGQRELCRYLRVPVQWAEPWQEDLLQVFSKGDLAKLNEQLASRIKGMKLVKAKRVRGDPKKIALLCRKPHTLESILAIVTTPAGLFKAFELNYIQISLTPMEDEVADKELQEYLSERPFPLTNDWRKVKITKELNNIAFMVKEALIERHKEDTITACSIDITRNVGSVYRQKAAIVSIDGEKFYGKYVYVAWTENNKKLSIKQIGTTATTIQEAKEKFNFYGISPLAYTEIKFENDFGWYSTPPKFIEEAMTTIMEGVRDLRTNVDAGYSIKAGYQLLGAATIPRGGLPSVPLREGERFFYLKVKRNQIAEAEYVGVHFIHEEYCKVFAQ